MTISGCFKTISRGEWKFIFWVVVLVILISTTTLVYGYFTTPKGMFFTGLHALAAGDFNVYYSHIEQVKQGNWILKDIFTSEPHSPFFFNPFWLLIGLFGRLFSLSNIFTYQFFRIILTPIFLISIYLLVTVFFKETAKRKITFIFLIFASGLGGWLFPLFSYFKGASVYTEYWPMDLWVTEGQTFLSIYHSPHFIFSSTLIIIIFLLLYFSYEYKNFKYLFYAGIANLFLLFFHPFHLPTILTIPLVYIFVISFKEWKIKWDYIFKYIIFIFLSLPAIVYHFLLLAANDIVKGRAAQNLCFTPVWWITIVSYGFLVPLALYGIYRQRSNFDNKKIFLLVWLVCQSLLIYAPLVFQRRLTQGLQFPLIIFACFGLFFLKGRIKKLNLVFKHKELFFVFMLIFFSFSNLYVIAQDFSFFTYQKYKEAPYFFYFENEYREAFSWLKNNLTLDDVILSDAKTGNFVAGFSGRTVYIGQSVETLDFEKKWVEMKEFYQDNQNDEQKAGFLRENRIKYVFYGKFEQRFGDFKPAEKDYLKLVFHRGVVSIFEVIL